MLTWALGRSRSRVRLAIVGAVVAAGRGGSCDMKWRGAWQSGERPDRQGRKYSDWEGSDSLELFGDRYRKGLDGRGNDMRAQQVNFIAS